MSDSQVSRSVSLSLLLAQLWHLSELLVVNALPLLSCLLQINLWTQFNIRNMDIKSLSYLYLSTIEPTWARMNQPYQSLRQCNFCSNVNMSQQPGSWWTAPPLISMLAWYVDCSLSHVDEFAQTTCCNWSMARAGIVLGYLNCCDCWFELWWIVFKLWLLVWTIVVGGLSCCRRLLKLLWSVIWVVHCSNLPKPCRKSAWMTSSRGPQ